MIDKNTNNRNSDLFNDSNLEIKKIDRKGRIKNNPNLNEIKRSSLSGWVKPSTAFIEHDSQLFIKGFGDAISNGGGCIETNSKTQSPRAESRISDNSPSPVSPLLKSRMGLIPAMILKDNDENV